MARRLNFAEEGPQVGEKRDAPKHVTFESDVDEEDDEEDKLTATMIIKGLTPPNKRQKRE